MDFLLLLPFRYIAFIAVPFSKILITLGRDPQKYATDSIRLLTKVVTICTSAVAVNQFLAFRESHAMDIQMRGVELKIDGVNLKVDAVNSKVDTVNSKVDTVNSKVDAVNSKVDAVNSKVDAVSSKVDTSMQKLTAIEKLLQRRWW